MEYLLIVLFLILGFLIFKKVSPSYEKKSPAIKKDELISRYHNDMKEIVLKYKKDENLFKKKKIEYLKFASHELHNNIFFEEHEAKQIIKELAAY